jgi:hypothetical protein
MNSLLHAFEKASKKDASLNKKVKFAKAMQKAQKQMKTKK